MYRLSHVLAHQDRHAEMQVETAEAQLSREWALAHGRADGDCGIDTSKAVEPCAPLALETGTDSAGSCVAACTCGS
jgi:hypothetical protein